MTIAGSLHLRAAGVVATLFLTVVPLACQERGRSDASGHRGSVQCAAVDSSHATGVQKSDVVGEFELEMQVTEGVRRDSVVRGRLTLEPWSPSTSGLETAPINYMVWGWTTIPIDRIGEMPVVPAPSSDDPARPGILGLRSRRDSAITLVMGAWTPDGGAVADAGLVLKVAQAETSGFRGTWTSSSIKLPVPSGHFCARRVQGGESAPDS